MNFSCIEFDVLIVGAGPSGVQCALTLHRKGHRVAIISPPNPLGIRKRIAECDDEKNVSLKVSIKHAKENQNQVLANRIPIIWGHVTSITENGSLWEAHMGSEKVSASNIVLATGAPNDQKSRMDLSHLDELETDGEGRVVLDENYETVYRGLYAVGEAISGYVRTLACAMGTGNSVACSLSESMRACKKSAA